jgi:hypothetical protein
MLLRSKVRNEDRLFSAFINGSGESVMEFYRELQDSQIHMSRGIRTIGDSH